MSTTLSLTLEPKFLRVTFILERDQLHVELDPVQVLARLDRLGDL